MTRARRMGERATRDVAFASGRDSLELDRFHGRYSGLIRTLPVRSTLLDSDHAH